jgi:cytochrome c-type biogenesis protein CcmH/NrfG
MVPDPKREPCLNTEPEVRAADVEDVERLIDEAERRSRKIRLITVSLVVGLIAFGALLVLSVYRQHEKDKARQAELQISQAETRKALEAQARLQQQAENSRKASMLLASGANKARYQKQWKEALADYDEALALDPDNPEALGLAGYLRFRMGDTQSAERMLQRAVEVDPTSPWHHYNLALALWANGRKQQAIVEVEQVLKIDPSFKSIIAGDRQFSSFKADRSFILLIEG